MVNVIIFILSMSGLYYFAKEIVGDWFPIYNTPALLIILCGLLAVFTFLFGIRSLPDFIKAAFETLYKQDKDASQRAIREMVSFSKKSTTTAHDRTTLIQKLEDDFLKNALHVKLEGFLSGDSLYRVLLSKAAQRYQERQSLVDKMKTLARFSPALGMIGTILSIIGYASQLNKAVMTSGVGDLLMVCLFSTLYGFLFANFIFLPLSLKLDQAARNERRKNELIALGIKSISKGTNPTILLEELNALVPKNHQVALESAMKSGGLS